MAERAQRKPARPRVKDWTRTAGYRDVRAALTQALGLRAAADPLIADKVEEYMALWCQRQALYDDVRKRGPTVTDDRGRITENRSISLGVQVSKLLRAMEEDFGFQTAPASPQAETDEEDPL